MGALPLYASSGAHMGALPLYASSGAHMGALPLYASSGAHMGVRDKLLHTTHLVLLVMIQKQMYSCVAKYVLTFISRMYNPWFKEKY